VSIAVTPASASVTVSGTRQYTATGTYSNGTTQNLTSSVTWSSSSTAVATISSTGIATGVVPGGATIKATSGTITGSTSLTVSASTVTLVSIEITPANAHVAVGASLQLTATGTNSNGTTQNLTSSVTWSSSSTAVATISSAGVATGVAAGSATIKASLGLVSNSTTVTMTSTPGPVAWWKFDDGSGTTAVDSSGYGYNATLYNSVTWVTGPTGNAISANGVNQYVSTPDVNLSSTSTITIAMWVNRTYGSAATNLFENSANYNNSTTGFAFFPDDSGDCGIANSMEIGVHGNVGYTANCYAQPTSGVWHHIAVVYDKTKPGASVVSLYIDGVLQKPSEQPYTATNTNAFGDNRLYIFSRAGTTRYAAGEMGDLRVYNVALTATQIEQIYKQ